MCKMFETVGTLECTGVPLTQPFDFLFYVAIRTSSSHFKLLIIFYLSPSSNFPSLTHVFFCSISDLCCCCFYFQDFCSENCIFPSLNLGSICRQTVKVREQSEEDDQFSYETSSLQSLKAFEWLSLDHFSSSDESPQSVVRIPGSYFPKSPTPRSLASKEETNKNKRADNGEKRKNVRAASAPRPRAVLSSPDNDVIVGSKTRTRRDLLLALKNHNSCQNRHTKCKVFPSSGGHHKEPVKPKNCIRAKGRTTLADSSVEQDSKKG